MLFVNSFFIVLTISLNFGWAIRWLWQDYGFTAAIAGMLKDVAYQANTQEFWNACSDMCDESDYRLGGSFFDGKGQPMQTSAVSHGCATTRFNGVNVINTARKI